MVTTPFIRDCIVDKERTHLIPGAIAAGTSQYGMQTFDQSIFGLFKGGFITYDEALRWATNVDEFKLKVQGISTTADISRDQMAKNHPSVGAAPRGPTRPQIAPAPTHRTRFGGPAGGQRGRQGLVRPYVSAYIDALKMLARRELSEAQVRQRLARKGHDAGTIDSAIARLREERAIDDARVAGAIARTQTSIRGRGKLRVRRQIEHAGIAAPAAPARSMKSSAISMTTRCCWPRWPNGFEAARRSPTSANSSGFTGTCRPRASSPITRSGLLKARSVK